MAGRLKDIYFTDESVARIADLLAEAYPAFDRARFLELVHDETWPDLELKGRLRRVAECLGPVLPASYDEALDVLRAAVPRIGGFEALIPAEFVLCFGQDPEDWDRSLGALAFFTRYGSAEFAVRPFLERDPDRALERVLIWAEDEDEHDEIVRHACRTLLKAGDRRALRLFGLDDDSGLAVEGLEVEPAEVRISERIRFSCVLRVDPAKPRRVRVEYVVDFVKANGSRSPKVFKLTEREFTPGDHRLERRHSLADLSTRKHYPGRHGLAVVVNGSEKARTEFTLRPAAP